MMFVKTKVESSKIHGLGLFANEFIPKGKKVWEYTPWFDFSLTKDQTNLLSDAAKEQFFNYAYLSKDTGKYVLCSDDARFFNHQDIPNTTCVAAINADFEDALDCYSTRDIEVGEELTGNYAEFDTDPYDVIK